MLVYGKRLQITHILTESEWCCIYSEVLSGMVEGVQGRIIAVQVDISPGLPVFYMVGYLSGEVREAKERVRTALKNTGISLPAKRVSVNLAPADMHKYGSYFDLAIAVGLLQSLSIVPENCVENTLILGELSLDGTLNPVQGILPIVKAAAEAGITRCIVPKKNGSEAALIEDIEVYTLESIEKTIQFLTSGDSDLCWQGEPMGTAEKESYPDFSAVKGQHSAKRAIEIAAAGCHNLLLDGPPGVGKSMLASCIPGIMPELTMEEQIDVTMIYSVRGLLSQKGGLVKKRPFRAPSHTITQAGMFGGGIHPKPGEISLAHKGVLFLDEFPEFGREMIDMLRIPMEHHSITMVRNHTTLILPADFLLIAAANPCPCGYYPDRSRCRCTERNLKRYQNRLSGPILDRIDLSVRCEPLSYEVLTGTQQEESSERIAARVKAAWELQRRRYGGKDYRFNGRVSDDELVPYLTLDSEGESQLKQAYHQFRMSARGYSRCLKVARTIADLDCSDKIRSIHVVEALTYRRIYGAI